MARLEPAEIRLRREEVVIGQPIDEILAECSDQLCGHLVQVRIANEDLAVSADRELLTVTIAELIANAAKYSGADSPIVIATQEKDHRLLISVHNEGSVIDVEDRELIFERSYRSSATRYCASGSGIGLSIAKKTAEAQQGHIWVTKAALAAISLITKHLRMLTNNL
jgi:two-component system, OmpR family, sensor histidine kinase KdpD